MPRVINAILLAAALLYRTARKWRLMLTAR